ncbi:unnamed protein product [Bemisia tabaci]|uniref:Uncharacterized protein n=1 Tax=Bemisia tabaci TaxID=7038 RepID=A0A9P0AH53_BEMTA|nr:unnamed protein product [Bemisia tabaci]
MDEISKLAKELIEVKKIAEASKRRNETDTWTEIGLFLDGVDDKIKNLKEEEIQKKEELAQLKSKKLQISEKEKSLVEEHNSLKQDIDYLKVENARLANQVMVYEGKIKLSKSFCLAPEDEKALQIAIDKINIFRQLTGIKFASPPSGKFIEGCIYNEKKNFLKRFKTICNKSDPEIWKMIGEASHSDWGSFLKTAKVELSSTKTTQEPRK